MYVYCCDHFSYDHRGGGPVAVFSTLELAKAYFSKVPDDEWRAESDDEWLAPEDGSMDQPVISRRLVDEGTP